MLTHKSVNILNFVRYLCTRVFRNIDKKTSNINSILNVSSFFFFFFFLISHVLFLSPLLFLYCVILPPQYFALYRQIPLARCRSKFTSLVHSQLATPFSDNLIFHSHTYAWLKFWKKCLEERDQQSLFRNRCRSFCNGMRKIWL